MIKIQKHDDKQGKIGFVTDMSTSLANAIRRSALEVPIMAVDDVEILKNDSALYDEIIAHRLGLIPIKTDKLSKEVKFKLKAVGPKTVYSTDLSPSVGTDFKLPIVILDDEQEVQILATARPGKGVDHIKHSPGLIYFKHNLEPDVIDFVYVDEEGNASASEEEMKTKGLSEEQINKIKKVKEANELVMNIESWGQLKVKDIFLKSIDVLSENLKELAKAAK